MPFEDIHRISRSILGDSTPPKFSRKVIFVMYLTEVQALCLEEINTLVTTVGRDSILRIFYFDPEFIDYIYSLFLSSKIEKLMPEIYTHLFHIYKRECHQKTFHISEKMWPHQ
jgi:hypothetical protein